MSGPIVPPLEVTEVDGSPDGRPITKLIVSNGDLTISGRTATIDTSGSATSPGGADREIQWNDGGDFQGGDSGATCTIRATDAYIGGSVIGGGYWGIASNDAANAGVQIKGIQTDGTTGANLYVGNGDTRQGIMLDALGSGGGGADGPVYIGRGLITTSGASMPLTLTAADEGVRTSITIETGVNGGITMKAIGTGSYNFEQQSTDGDTLVKVLANGTGTPKVKLENGSMAVQTICEANKKFTIEGGNGGETFVFDVSSATGGITWPDGTEQITAASGGGNAFNVELTPYGAYDGTTTYNMLDTPPYGNASYSAEGYGDTDVKFHAFIAPYSGDVATAIIYCNGTGDDVELAVYADDGNGFPSTLLGTFDFDASSTGASSTSVFSSTITTVRGTQYWLGHTGATAVSLRTSSATYSPAIGPVVSIDNTSINAWLWDGQTSHQTVVAGDKTDFVPKKIERIKLGFTWS